MVPGTRQSQRLAAALRPGFVLPDELTLAERIRATLEFANRLAFVDAQGQAAGHWGQALERDEAVILADIAGYPIEQQQAAFMAGLDSEPLASLMSRLWLLVTRMDAWYQLLRSLESPDGLAVAEVLGAGLQGHLGISLGRCLARYGHALELGPGRTPGQVLDRAWKLGAAKAIQKGRLGVKLAPLPASDPQLVSGPSPAELTDSAPDAAPGGVSPGLPERDLLRSTLLSFAQALLELRTLALDRLPSSLRSGQHEPAMGLLLAFLQLQQQAQAPLNRFPERLKTFYFRDILGMRPRPATREQAFLLLEVEPTFADAVQITQGQRFVGGRTAAGAAIEFAADQACLLSQARVAALYSLTLERDPLVSPEHHLGLATRAKARHLPLRPAEGEWNPLFAGVDGAKASQAEDARLGMAISTPLFELSEGERELRVTLQLSHPADHDAHLRDLLKLSSDQGDAEAWLASVFACYQAQDALETPPHGWPCADEPGAEAALDPLALARQALLRGALAAGDQRLRFLLARCLATREPLRLAERLGILFSVWLLDPSEHLLGEEHQALRAHARLVFADAIPAEIEAEDPLALVFSEQPLERHILFDRIFRTLWTGQVSTAKGWLTLDSVFPSLQEPVRPGRGGRIELTMRLGSELPAICPCDPVIHGGQWPAHAALKLELHRQARVFGYSLACRLEWRELDLAVSVRRVRDVLVYNQVGRLDPSKPFQPFGPMPELGGYLVLGSAELASKPLRALQVRLGWANLPRLEGGFPEQYAGYPGNWAAEAFQVQLSILKDGQWQGGEPGQGLPLALFAPVPGQRRVAASIGLTLDATDLRRYYRPSASASSGLPFDYSLRSRNGFFRFELSGPAQAFGHALYPGLLTTALTRNARQSRLVHQAPLPRAPYTPVVQWLELDYQAGHSLHQGQDLPGAAGDAEQGLHRVFHLHAFGQEEIFPGGRHGPLSLLPRLAHDGNLYIGLQVDEPLNMLNLFFHLCQEAAGPLRSETRPAHHWAAWCGDGWRELAPRQVVADGTLGFLRSGIVCLEVPRGMSQDCPQLPGGCQWLRLSADWGFDTFAGVYGVHINAIAVSRVEPPAPEAATLPLPAGTIRASLQHVAGLKSILQVGSSFGLRPADTQEQLEARSSERLSHKGRASSAWDFARLLLDRFPQAFQVKVFPHQLASEVRWAGQGLDSSGIRPGQVLVVVVPWPQANVGFELAQGPRLDAATLESMAEYLRQLASPGLRLVVRNAAYEAVQVRAAVRLARGSHPGTSLRQLNQAIINYLSPWQPGGYQSSFDWTVRTEDLEAHLRAQPGVEALGPLSLLHLVASDQCFHTLADTARRESVGTPWTSLVRPAMPWSLVVPTQTHLIESVDDLTLANPPATGIGLLAIGSTFISGGVDHGQ